MGDGVGDGDGVGVGVATTAAFVAGDELLSRSATKAPTNRAAAMIAANATSCCFDVNERPSGTVRLQNAGLASSDAPAATATDFSAEARPVGRTTVTSLMSGPVAMLSRKREMSITRRPDGDSVPTFRKAAMFGLVATAACSSPSRSAVSSNSCRKASASGGRFCGFFSSV